MIKNANAIWANPVFEDTKNEEDFYKFKFLLGKRGAIATSISSYLEYLQEFAGDEEDGGMRGLAAAAAACSAAAPPRAAATAAAALLAASSLSSELLLLLLLNQGAWKGLTGP